MKVTFAKELVLDLWREIVFDLWNADSWFWLLQDVYESLSSAGFKSRQVEQAMENTIFYGGDLMDALDWLCLNTPNGLQQH